MKVFLAGVGCVGKSSTGAQLAKLLGCAFFDLDDEIEAYFQVPVERLQDRYKTGVAYRKEASKALAHVISREAERDWVIALTPNGLKDHYWKVVETAKATVLVMLDRPENILARITFYDEDSQPLEMTLTDEEKSAYLQQITRDIKHHRRTNLRAHQRVDISGLGINAAALKLRDVLLTHTNVQMAAR